MSQGSRRCPLLTSFDAVGVEATDQINYRGLKTYKTAVGGCVTLFAYTLIFVIAAVMFGNLLGPPQYAQSIYTSYINDENAEPFYVETTQAVPAIKILAADPHFNITKYWTGLFSVYYTGESAVTFYPAVSCLEKFKNGP